VKKKKKMKMKERHDPAKMSSQCRPSPPSQGAALNSSLKSKRSQTKGEIKDKYR
jgi:hypothetical protein